MERARFTLPEKCGCGACGTVTFEQGDVSEPGDSHPQIRVVEVDGPFRLDGLGDIVCLNCEDAANDDEES